MKLIAWLQESNFSIFEISSRTKWSTWILPSRLVQGRIKIHLANYSCKSLKPCKSDGFSALGESSNPSGSAVEAGLQTLGIWVYYLHSFYSEDHVVWRISPILALLCNAVCKTAEKQQANLLFFCQMNLALTVLVINVNIYPCWSYVMVLLIPLV